MEMSKTPYVVLISVKNLESPDVTCLSTSSIPVTLSTLFIKTVLLVESRSSENGTYSISRGKKENVISWINPLVTHWFRFLFAKMSPKCKHFML